MGYHDDHDGIGQEPRKVWINKLLNYIDAAWYPLLAGNTTESLRAMRGIIAVLDAHSKTKPLAQLLTQLEDYEKRPPNSRIELEHALSRIMDYLHAHQLKEFDRGITEADFERLEKEGSEEE